MATAMGAIPGSLTVSHARRRRNQFQAYSKGYIQRAAFFGDVFQQFGKRLFVHRAPGSATERQLKFRVQCECFTRSSIFRHLSRRRVSI
jgi:hypothetical protein